MSAQQVVEQFNAHKATTECRWQRLRGAGLDVWLITIDLAEDDLLQTHAVIDDFGDLTPVRRWR